jgi:hypothetical protein
MNSNRNFARISSLHFFTSVADQSESVDDRLELEIGLRKRHFPAMFFMLEVSVLLHAVGKSLLLEVSRKVSDEVWDLTRPIALMGFGPQLYSTWSAKTAVLFASDTQKSRWTCSGRFALCGF